MLSMVSSNQRVAGNSAGANASGGSDAGGGSMNTGPSVAHAMVSLSNTQPQQSERDNYSARQQATQPHAAQQMYATPAFSMQVKRENFKTESAPVPASSQARHHTNSNTHSTSVKPRPGASSTVMATAPGAPAPKKRSTKSKCSPGLRSGKWTSEEEAFTNMIIHFFKRGLLDVEDGTSLRWYLAKRLNCEAMRVTKKLKGNSSIGKQIFRAIENSPMNRQAIRRAREELAVLESRFVESLTTGGVATGASVPGPGTPLAVAVRGRKILPNMPASFGIPGDGVASGQPHPLLAPAPTPPASQQLGRSIQTPATAGMAPIVKSEDAKLLLHFFSEAQDPNEPDTEKEPPQSKSLSVDLSAHLGKKRPLSSMAGVTGVERTSEESSRSEKTNKPASPPSKRQTVKIENLMG